MSKVIVNRKVEGMTRLEEYYEVISLLNGTALPIMRPSRGRIMLNLEEIKLYRQGMVYTKDPPKKYGGDDTPPTVYVIDDEVFTTDP